MKKIILLVFLVLVSLNAGENTIDDSGYKWKVSNSFSVAYYSPKKGDTLSIGFISATPFSLYTKSFNFNIEAAIGSFMTKDDIHRYTQPFRVTLSGLYRVSSNFMIGPHFRFYSFSGESPNGNHVTANSAKAFGITIKTKLSQHFYIEAGIEQIKEEVDYAHLEYEMVNGRFGEKLHKEEYSTTGQVATLSLIYQF